MTRPADPGAPIAEHAPTAAVPVLDLGADPVTLTAALCDLVSVSGGEGRIADAVQAALSGLTHLRVTRDGDAVVARTEFGRRERVVLAGHLDTVPVAGNLPSRLVGDLITGTLHGRARWT